MFSRHCGCEHLHDGKVTVATIMLSQGAAAAVTKRTKESREPAGGLGWESFSVL